MTTDPVLPENDRRFRTIVLDPAGEDEFTYDFIVEAADWLKVYVDDVEVAFTVDLAAKRVTLDVPAALGAVVVIEGHTSLDRQLLYPLRGGLPSARLNGEINQLFYAMQEHRRDSGRQMQVSKSVGVFNPVLAAIAAGRALIVNADATAFAMGPTADEIQNAQGFAVDAGNSALAAYNSALAVAAAVLLAQDWAVKTDAPVSGGLYGARYYAELAATYAPPNNWSGGRAPTPDDDATDGWIQGSYWVDDSVNPMEVYVCVINTATEAVWITTTFTIDEVQPLLDAKQPVNPRVQSAASGDLTPTSQNDLCVRTAQAAALKINNPTGTMVEGQALMMRIKDDGTAQAITWDTAYRAVGVDLPDTTVIGKQLYVAMIWNNTDGMFDVTGVAQEE